MGGAGIGAGTEGGGGSSPATSGGDDPANAQGRPTGVMAEPAFISDPWSLKGKSVASAEAEIPGNWIHGTAADGKSQRWVNPARPGQHIIIETGNPAIYQAVGGFLQALLV
jgi:hypothetical protein